MVRHGKRSVSKIQRWWCPVCDKWGVDRGAAKNLRSTEGYGFVETARLVSQGLSVLAIAKRTGRQWQSVKRRMGRIEAAARTQHAMRPPGIGGGWALVDLPPGHLAGKAAVGRQRQSRRLVGWEVGPVAEAALVSRLGAATHEATLADEEWLRKALGSCAKSPQEAEQRLWVILAFTNGWRFAPEPAPEQGPDGDT